MVGVIPDIYFLRALPVGDATGGVVGGRVVGTGSGDFVTVGAVVTSGMVCRNTRLKPGWQLADFRPGCDSTSYGDVLETHRMKVPSGYTPIGSEQLLLGMSSVQYGADAGAAGPLPRARADPPVNPTARTAAATSGMSSLRIVFFLVGIGWRLDTMEMPCRLLRFVFLWLLVEKISRRTLR